ncbi:hypothetical protein COE25_24375 [Bacillus sp. AFS031507]|jgi:hypothetical protein|nr:hypothetical protein COE25_24375 [Bacillus sp. AFS031507]
MGSFFYISIMNWFGVFYHFILTEQLTNTIMDQFINHESQIYYDEMAASPWFRYLDKNGTRHEV